MAEWVVITRIEGTKTLSKMCLDNQVPEGWRIDIGDDGLSPEEWAAKHVGKRINNPQIVYSTGTEYKHAQDENGNNIHITETTKIGQKKEIARALYKKTGHEWDIVE